MGAQLVKVVLSSVWSPVLTPKAQLLLAFMALTARDKDVPPVFFGSRDSMIIHVIGDLEEDKRKRNEQSRNISKWLRELRDAGAIEPVAVPAKGRRGAYKIFVIPSTLDGLRPRRGAKRVAKSATQHEPENVELGGEICHPPCGETCHTDSERVAGSATRVWQDLPPLRTTEETSSSRTEIEDPSLLQSQPHDRAPEEDHDDAQRWTA